jgi:hypothetical protein
LKDVGLLTAFRVGDSGAGAQLGDANHEVEFSQRHLEAMVLSRPGDVERVIQAVAVVLEELRPTKVGRPSFTFQHIDPLDQDYDEARQRALASLFGRVEFGPVVLGDFANLIDGVTADPATTVHIEYGVVSAEEIPPKLSDARRRSAGLGRQRRPEPVKGTGELPAVAFFMEASWTLVDRIDDENVLDEFTQAWEACRGVSEDLAKALRHHLFEATHESED